jgi:hypothetical protein
LALTPAFAQDASFRDVKMPNPKGKLIKSVLTFKDSAKAVEIRPAKGQSVTIPYQSIDNWAYKFTTERTVAMTEGKTHWLEVDYQVPEGHKTLVLQMQKHDYIRILDAVKKHTGMDVDLEGNANKRR